METCGGCPNWKQVTEPHWVDDTLEWGHCLYTPEENLDYRASRPACVIRRYQIVTEKAKQQIDQLTKERDALIRAKEVQQNVIDRGKAFAEYLLGLADRGFSLSETEKKELTKELKATFYIPATLRTHAKNSNVVD